MNTFFFERPVRKAHVSLGSKLAAQVLTRIYIYIYMYIHMYVYVYVYIGLTR